MADTTLPVTRDTWRAITALKLELGARTVNDVIARLLTDHAELTRIKNDRP